MHRIGRRPARPRFGATFLLLALSAFGAVPLAAQDAPRDCRCIGADGDPIENCVCVRTFGGEALRGFAFATPRARIGVTIEADPRGARVTDVLDGSPAEEAGIVVGDVITRVDGVSLLEPLPDDDRERRIDPLGDEAAVSRMMVLAAEWEAGEAVDVEVTRAGEGRTFTVETEEAPTVAVRAFGRAPGVSVFGPDGFDFDRDSLVRAFRFDADSLARTFRFHADSLHALAPMIRLRADSLARGAAVLAMGDGCVIRRPGLAFFGADCVDGVRLIEINEDLGDYFGVSEGVLVSDVSEDSALGLRAGDVIVSIGGRAVARPEDALRILSSYGSDEEVTMRVMRQGSEVEVTGRRR